MDNSELWWKLFQEYASEARHHEQQRATVTGFFSALAAGVLTLVGMDKALSLSDLPASLFLVVIGVFGCLFSAKQYERYFVCMERARQYRLALQEAMPGSKILELKKVSSITCLEARFVLGCITCTHCGFRFSAGRAFSNWCRRKLMRPCLSDHLISPSNHF